ncbi:hypothetical protein [Modestobacter excelsi]|uniref:hypothetical protein n=1 Tax=Modestobacter excelsi TaxID=2213161 RepID=UPI00110C9362|nr:hypothetical protein [Modestobacter excelsi]
MTPDNYLEKIFQLPVWLDPPSGQVATAMALGLLGHRDDRPSPAAAAPGGTPSAEDPTAPRFKTWAEQHPASDEPVGEVDLATSPPRSVVLQEDEMVAIGWLAPLLTRSPRAFKRYLNTYRLLKAVIPDEDLAQARFLLALATGRPDLGERLLTAIPAAPGGCTLGELMERWPGNDRSWLTRSGPLDQNWHQVECADMVPVVADVRRFVFRAAVQTQPRPRRTHQGRAPNPAAGGTPTTGPHPSTSSRLSQRTP